MESKHSHGVVLSALRKVAGAAALLAGGALASPASAADVCIQAKAKEALAQCPGGGLQQSIAKKPQMTFKSAPAGVSLKKGDQQTKPSNPSASMSAAQRDERRARMAKKQRQLLVTEIQGLESLFSSTPKSSQDRPKLMRRLAEAYVELESAAFRDKTEAGMKADEAKAKGSGNVAAFREEAGKADKVLDLSRQQAIKYYTSLKSQFPKYCQTSAADPAKSTGCGDEVLYYLAYEYEQANKLDDARKVYLELIQSWPASKYIPNAYLAFGELFFNDAQGDPSKWDLAEQSYTKVVGYPPPDNKVFGYAHYKLGYVYWNKGDFARALSEFKKTIEYGVQYSTLPNAEQLATSARRDMIPVYALAGDPKRAYDFIKPLSGDGGGSTEHTFKLMDDLGQNYLDTGHYPEGIALYQDLKNRDRGPKFCVYQGHITEATLAMKSGNKDVIMTELKNQLDVHNTFVKGGAGDADAKLKCSNITADLLAETGMAWHLEAVGSGGVRGTGDRKTMALAADLYAMVVKNFKADDFAKFEFPRIVKEDWPTIFKIKYEMADLLWFQKDWAKCGPAFDAVVAEDPTGPLAAEAAYASVLCYQNIYTEQHQGGADRKGSGNLPGGKKDKEKKADKSKQLAPKDFTEGQKGMITAFNRYICYIKPDASNKEALDNYVEVKFARARTYFEAQHWEEAALGFRDVAMTYPDKEVGVISAQLYLEALNVMGSSIEPTRPSCFDDMKADVPTFIDKYCQGDKARTNSEQCSVLNRIQRDIERLSAEETVKAADRGGADAPKMYEKAASTYLDMWKKYSEKACEEKSAGCERAEEILYNSAKAFQAARLLAKAISVRKILLDSKYGLHNTELAKKAVYEIGGNYQAIAVYEEAASWYERFAREYPKADKAPDALQDAVIFRLGLGQESEAIKDSELFNKNYGSSKPAQTAQIAFAIGAHYVEKEDWGEARKKLSSAMSLIDRNATVDVQIQAHDLLARAYVKMNAGSQAVPEYNKVRGLWKDPAAVVKKIQEGGDDRRVAKALTAVGEALFFFAEKQRVEVEKIRFPEYKGAGTREDVLKHINTKVKEWVGKKRPAIEAAEKEYKKIVDLQPAPPPRWVIAAGSRVGQMWGKFVAEFRAAPIPKEWKGHGIVPGTADLSYDELRGEYFAKLDEASEPQKLTAKGAFKTCLDYSVKYQFFDEYSRKCEEWLSKNYGAEYHLIDEFRGSPSRVNSGLNEFGQPVNLDGTVYQSEPPPAPADEKPTAAAEEKEEGKAEPDKKPSGKQSKEKSALDRAKRK
jgi:tetratricopeptide (TPR) repeat protein